MRVAIAPVRHTFSWRGV